MRAILFLPVAAFCLVIAAFSESKAVRAPEEVAGFKLSSDIEQGQERIDRETQIPVMDMRYLSEVNTKYIAGYAKGSVIYGACSEPGKVVRIKMKSEDWEMSSPSIASAAVNSDAGG